MARIFTIRSRAALGISLGLALFPGCSSSGPIVREDTSTAFSSYRSFQWVTQNQIQELKLVDPRIDYITDQARIVERPAQEQRVKPLIEAALKKQGYVLSQEARPDFYVTYYGKAKNDDWVSTWAGSTPAVDNVPVIIFPYYSRESTRTHREGVVYLTIYDARTQKPVWTGSISNMNFEHGLDGPALSAAIDQLTREFKESA